MPDEYLLSFWRENKRSDGREFLQGSPISLKVLDNNCLIMNHNDNIIQSKFSFLPSDNVVSYDQLLKGDQKRIPVSLIFQGDESQKVLLNQVSEMLQKQNLLALQDIYNRKTGEKVEFNLTLLFDNKSSTYGLVLSLMVQFYRFLR